MNENEVENESELEEGEDFVDLTEEEFDLILHKATRRVDSEGEETKDTGED